MADTVKVTREFKGDMYFSDNDTRMLTVDNPKANLGRSEILQYQTFLRENQPLLGDKGGAAFVRFNSAKIYERAVTKLDLEN